MFKTQNMKEDKQLLLITHLSQLLNLFTAIGGFVVPLVIWIMQKDKVLGMDAHGKMIINFQISMFIYTILSIPLVFLLGLGLIAIFAITILALIFPVINTIKVSNGEIPSYPFTIDFIK